MGRIVNVSADESVLNDKGVVDPLKLRPITFDPMNHTSRALGPVVAKAFEEGKKLK